MVTMGVVAQVRQRPFSSTKRATGTNQENQPMSNENVLRIDGEVEKSRELTFDDLAAIDASHQVIDVSQFDPKTPR